MRRIKIRLAVFLAIVFVSCYAPRALASLTATSVFEVQTGGSDTLNSGFYDTATTGKPTDLTTNTASGNTSAPVVKSASYNFNNTTDTNNWLYQSTSGGASGWQAGWYKITACSGNNATLDAAVGHVILSNFTTNTVAGISTAATPTSGTWSIDYSQQGGVQFSLTGLTTAAANAIILTASATKAMVGNGIQITGSTANFTTGFYVIQACSAGVSLTVDRNCTTAAGVAGTAGIGGALASPGQAGALIVTGNSVFIKTGTYSIGTGTVNTSGNAVSVTVSNNRGKTFLWKGYGTLRSDRAARPTLQCSGSATTILVGGSSNGWTVDNIIFDGNSKTTSKGLTGNNDFSIKWCSFKNFTNSAFTGMQTNLRIGDCDFNGCTTSTVVVQGVFERCYFTANTSIICASANSTFVNCIFNANTASCYSVSATGVTFANCSFYNNTATCINCSSSGSGLNWTIENCIFYGTTGWAILMGEAEWGLRILNCAFGSNSLGNYDTTTTLSEISGSVTLTADPFINAAGGNFALNRKSTGGALCQTAGVPGSFPGLSTTTGYLCIGAVETNRTFLRNRWR